MRSVCCHAVRVPCRKSCPCSSPPRPRAPLMNSKPKFPAGNPRSRRETGRSTVMESLCFRAEREIHHALKVSQQGHGQRPVLQALEVGLTTIQTLVVGFWSF
jgi:hypothetical protein